jgi:LacI family transcriptional regulator
MARKPHVALIVETSSVYGRQILRGVTHYLSAHGAWSIFLEQRALTSKLPAWLKNWQGDGIISRTSLRPLIQTLAKSRVRVVDLTDRYGDLGLPHIWSANESIGRLAAEHLRERGFGKFAFCGFAREYWSEQRLHGFVETAQQSGVVCKAYESPWLGAHAHPWEEEQQELAAWLCALPKPIGIMACNDLRGQQILDACNRVELGVPEEVAVIGVDNDELLCELCNPPLSSVVPNPECIGYKAAELLDRLMAGKRAEPQPLLIAPLGIATRQSTDVLAIDDPDVAAAIKFIREHACDGAKIQTILAQVPLSRSILERRFRKYLGHSPQQMLRQTQLKRVKQLLAKTDLPLWKIGELAGFKHTEYMCVAFKRHMGSTPGAYRRLSQI